MILESFIAKLNANIFLREFSFAKNTFLLSSGQEVEFADHVIWIGDSLIIYQLKEREVQSQTTQDSEIKWFENKVIKKAVKQIRATINFINSKETIIIENQRNIKIHMNGQEVKKMFKVILYLSSSFNTTDHENTKFYESSTAGFIHLIAFEDYIDILNTLVTPTETMEYLVFRQSLLERWENKSFIPSEKSFISQFIYGDNDQMPSSDYNVYFDRLINEFRKFDVHFLLESFLDKIVFNNTTDYYTILEEIATLNRTELGCFKN